jgi:dTDP-4-amino-4,6-dideoxygalactose transaminase
MSKNLKIDYPLTYPSWNSLEEKAILEVIKSNQYTYKKKVLQFEKDFSKYHNLKYGTMVNSGSSANLLAVSSLFYKKNNPLKNFCPCRPRRTGKCPEESGGGGLTF